MEVIYNMYYTFYVEGIVMDKVESEEQSEEQESKDDLSEFQLRSLDIDIAFYGTKLKKLKKTWVFNLKFFGWLFLVLAD